MSDEAFTHDVFLSHSAKDKAVVRPLAERLQVAVRQHLKVSFDEWVLKPGDSIPAKIEEGLDHSKFGLRISDFGFAQPCMSAKAFGSDWAQLEAGTGGRGNLPFRDPLNKERRFIPLRLDDAPIKGSLAQFIYINWRPADRRVRVVKETQTRGNCCPRPDVVLRAGLPATEPSFTPPVLGEKIPEKTC